MKTTREVLDNLPKKHKDYLERLKSDLVIINERHDSKMYAEYRAIAKGYIKALADCGVIDSFRTLWTWFTL
jgi:hypothetical protein